MNPEEKRLLEKTVRLSEENNMILRKMRRSAQWATAFRVIYWIVIIGVAIGAFYFIEPYLRSISNTYSTFQNDVNSFKRFVQ